jgi:hypothetical protein
VTNLASWCAQALPPLSMAPMGALRPSQQRRSRSRGRSQIRFASRVHPFGDYLCARFGSAWSLVPIGTRTGRGSLRSLRVGGCCPQGVATAVLRPQDRPSACRRTSCATSLAQTLWGPCGRGGTGAIDVPQTLNTPPPVDQRTVAHAFIVGASARTVRRRSPWGRGHC